MRLDLVRHRDSPEAPAKRIEVDIVRPSARQLVLHYTVDGQISNVRLPSLAAPARTDELWQHTCFEAFVRAAAGEVYYEFNFSPSTQWAAYRFTSYRSGVIVASDVPKPRIQLLEGTEGYELRASLDLDLLSELAADASWHVALSAVIEDTTGSKSYWALAHPPGRPDFHHADCFALELIRA